MTMPTRFSIYASSCVVTSMLAAFLMTFTPHNRTLLVAQALIFGLLIAVAFITGAIAALCQMAIIVRDSRRDYSDL